MLPVSSQQCQDRSLFCGGSPAQAFGCGYAAMRPVHARSSMRAVWESGLSEGPDCLIAYLSELRFINPRSDTSEF
jgi:hypothetical protein